MDNIKGLLAQFSEETTIHGLKKLVNAKVWLWRIFWASACVAATVTFIIQFGNLLQMYNSKPIRTVIEVNREPIDFPDITICPLRNLDFSVIKTLFDLSIDRTPGARSTRHPYDILASNDSRLDDEFIKAYYTIIGQYYHLYSKFFTTNNSLFGELMSRTNLLPNIEHSIIQTAKVPMWELLLQCRWRGIPCSSDRIKPFYDPYFLSCVTFEPERQGIVSEGVESGLSVMGIYGNNIVDWQQYLSTIAYPFLVVGLQEYGHPLSGDQGARVVLHRHGSPPMPSEEGFNVPPGFSVSLGIKFQTTFVLGEPYSTCSTVDPRGDENEVYRLLPCLRRCIQEEVVKACHCADARLPLAKNMSVNNMQGLKYCGQLEELPHECQFDVNPDPPMSCLKPLAEASDRIECGRVVQQEMEKRTTLMEDCGCFAPCDDVKYSVEYSLSGWPPGPEMDSIYAEYMSDFPYKLIASNSSTFKINLYANHFGFANRYEGLKDVSKINIHVADTSVVKIIQKPDYTSSDLLSDIGGQLGLWIGMSVLSFGELVQLVFDICLSLYSRHTNRKKITDVKPAKSEHESDFKKRFENYE